uniref:Uncharacterized protein n=1 Tax=Oncorhynchus kisutch TaxID=8019 RepID=A0A8C7LJP8_ONCKI
TTTPCELSLICQTTSQAIPTTRPVINDVIIQDYYSTTPGGTLFSMTPGGMKFLPECRTAPLARTTPCRPDIPGVTSPLSDNTTTDTSAGKGLVCECVRIHTYTCYILVSIIFMTVFYFPALFSSCFFAGKDAQFEMDI